MAQPEEGVTEEQRMVSGQLYRANDPVLVAKRTRARELTIRYNATGPTQAAERLALLRELLGEVGESPGRSSRGSSVTTASTSSSERGYSSTSAA